MKSRRIGIIGFDGVQALDVAGPADVFGLANDVLARKPAAYEVVLLGVKKGPIVTQTGILLYANATLAQSGLLDTIIVPGGAGLRLHPEVRSSLVRWLQANALRMRRVASVCTGVYALADSGLLDGRSATTHWRYARDLQERRPRVKVDADAIFIKDGKYYTSAGITAGIDLCLAFIEEDFGRELAMNVAREMVVYLRRSGGQLQYSAPLLLQVQAKDRFDDIAQWIRGHLNEDLTLEAKKYPQIVFRSSRIEKLPSGDWKVDGDLTLHGVTKPVSLTVKQTGDEFTTHTVLKQTDFGIKPIVVAGGVIKVNNEIELDFQIVPAKSI